MVQIRIFISVHVISFKNSVEILDTKLYKMDFLGVGGDPIVVRVVICFTRKYVLLKKVVAFSQPSIESMCCEPYFSALTTGLFFLPAFYIHRREVCCNPLQSG